MFIAKFSIAQGDKFTADKNGNMPLVGQVLAGSAHSAIINGTIAAREGVNTNRMYLCENEQVTLEGGAKVWNTTVLSEVSVLEYAQLRTQLGAGKRISQESTVAESAEAPLV